ncbi:MAG: thiamine pyrophosphate-binding protein [Cryobacterium sp.]
MPDARLSSSPATDFSVALLREFVRLGVRDVVLSPGARSQALALVAAELERLGEVRLHVRIDERGAGFLALGLAVETGVPALVIMTSGTAVANLHPAVLEAHHSNVPLIVLSADRPEELRGIRSNQTTVQPGIFGVTTRLAEDIAAPTAEHAPDATALAVRATQAALGAVAGTPGPVHLNLAFREPLSAAVTLDPAPAPAARAVSVESAPVDAVLIDPAPHTIVIAGAGSGAQAEAFARTGRRW